MCYYHLGLFSKSIVFFQELTKQIDDYTSTYEPEDQMEWNLVLGEIKAFIEVLQLDYSWS